MKALTLLQFFALKNKEIEKYCEYLNINIDIDEYYYIVSQPFTPELITKYFKGWG